LTDHLSSIAWTRTAHPDERQLTINGVRWYVYEDRRNAGDPSIVFESDRIARRVRNFPANWRELPDVELYAVSWSR
jgi:hypothetical protein